MPKPAGAETEGVTPVPRSRRLDTLIYTMMSIAIVVLVAAVFGAPLGERAHPGMSPNPAKAPWYFAGFQELLLHQDESDSAANSKRHSPRP